MDFVGLGAGADRAWEDRWGRVADGAVACIWRFRPGDRLGVGRYRDTGFDQLVAEGAQCELRRARRRARSAR